MTLFRIIAIILALLLCVFVPGCADSNPAPDTGTAKPTEAPGTEEPVSEEDTGIVIADSGKDDYIVVRSDFAGSYEVQAAVKLKNAIAASYPSTFDNLIKTDFVMTNKQNDTIDVEGKEILVGNTNRRQSRDIYATLTTDDYVITVKDDKLVIIGGSEYATAEACEYFIENYLSEPSADGVFRLSSDLHYEGKRAESRPPMEEGAILRYMSWNLGCGVGVESEALYVLEQYMPDIIGLQESNAEIHNGVINVFLNNHKEYAHAAQYHQSGTLDYTPILYNTKLLTLVEGHVEWLRDRYTGTNTKSVCWAVFEYTNGKKFAVINFHGAVCNNSYSGYEYYSSDELSQVAQMWRTGNVKQILEIRDGIFGKYGQIPVTINGDCNFNSTTSQYNTIISNGFSDCELTAARRIRFGYKTSYSYASGIPGPGNSIDHIFGSNGVYFALFDTVRDGHVAQGSDHTPIFTDYNPFGREG